LVEAKRQCSETIAGEEKLRLQLDMIRESIHLNREKSSLGKFDPEPKNNKALAGGRACRRV
jgi:hypothetical protein